MPHFFVPIGTPGPVLDVDVWLPERRRKALAADGKDVPSVMRLRALVDTGAGGTHVDLSVLNSLGLEPTGKTSMPAVTAGDELHETETYDVWIGIPHNEESVTFPNIRIAAASRLHERQGFHVLLGRDILARCLFIYDGRANTFTLAF